MVFKIRYVGVGAMVIGGISSIFKVRKGLSMQFKYLKTIILNLKSKIKKERNISPKSINILSFLAIFLVMGVYYNITQSAALPFNNLYHGYYGFLFHRCCILHVGLVGNSNSPVSGMTITAVLFTGGLLFVFGFSGKKE